MSKNGENVVPLVGTMLSCMINRGPDGAGLVADGHIIKANSIALMQPQFQKMSGKSALVTGASRGIGRSIAHALASGGAKVAVVARTQARAVEAAPDRPCPPRADWLRALMAELERIANHLGDIGAICNDAAFALLHTHFGILREQVLRAAAGCFGHRLMMDRVVPGGVAPDLDASGGAALRDLAALIEHRLPELVALYDRTASLQDRTVTTGRLAPALALRFGAGGHVGRASGRDFDARRDLAYPPYDRLDVAVPVLTAGDVDARVRIRISEVETSLALTRQLLDGLPEGPLVAELPLGESAGREGMAVVESFRGDVLMWLRLDAEGRIERCHPRDPSWFQWPLLEAAIEGNIVADFPLCNKSFNCSYSGHDL